MSVLSLALPLPLLDGRVLPKRASALKALLCDNDEVHIEHHIAKVADRVSFTMRNDKGKDEDHYQEDCVSKEREKIVDHFYE